MNVNDLLNSFFEPHWFCPHVLVHGHIRYKQYTTATKQCEALIPEQRNYNIVIPLCNWYTRTQPPSWSSFQTLCIVNVYMMVQSYMYCVIVSDAVQDMEIPAKI